jgi:hypothetical protein
MAVVLFGYMAAAFVITWRLWADPASRTVAGNPDDADLFAWYMRYAAIAVAHGRLPSLATTALNAPQGVNLMWNSSMLLPCILLAPVTLLAGPQVSLTLLTTVGFAGSAAAMFLVLRRWRVSVGSAALAGAVYGFCPALLHSAIGHYDWQLAILPPLIIDAGLRVVIGRPESRLSRPNLVPPHVLDGIWLGLFVAAELFISEELVLTTALAGLLLVAGLAAGFPAMAVRRFRQAAAGLSVAACLTLALTGWALWAQFAGPLTESGSPFTADFYENDLTGFVTPSSYLLFHTSASAAAAARYQGQAPEYLGYLGWPLIIALTLAIVMFAARPVVRALAVVIVALVVLSLGGHPLVGGHTDVGVTLPWHWIEGLPLAGSVLPDRFSVLIDGMVAALLAVCLDLARARLPGRKGLLPSALAVLACLPLLPRPLPTATAPPLPAGWSAVLDALRLPEGARILVVPVPEVHLTAPMRWQADTSTQYSLIGGYFIGPAWNGYAYIDGNGLAPTAVYLDELWFAGLRPGSAQARAVAAANLGAPGAAPSAAQVRADLAAWRPAAVLADTTGGSVLARYLLGLFGPPAVHSGDMLAWRLR